MTLDTKSRRLDWPDCTNVRDLGGLPTADGRQIRWGAVVRSDVLWRLTEVGRRSLLDHGIRTIVDVRFADEVAGDDGRYPFRDSVAVGYLNVPFDARREMERSQVHAAYAATTTRSDVIRVDLDIGRNGIADAIAAIADAPPGGVLIHCHAGKDRTGIIVAVLLSWLGVPDEEIADDYEQTMASIEPLLPDWLGSQSDDPAEHERLRLLHLPTRKAMLDSLDYVRARYGSAEAYLRGAGVTHEQLTRLRQRLLAS